MLDARSAITAAVRRALADLGVGPEIEPIVERSARPEFGDWSTPVAQRCARVLRRDPPGIAADLRDRVSATPVAGVREWTVSGAYVNAHLDDTVWAPSVLESALALDPAVTVSIPEAFSAVAGKTLVEHTATNPNKAAHVGHLRNACIGDTMARVLRRTGHTVEVDNYIDDTGVQVADVTVGIRDLGLQPQPGEPFDQFCSRVYVEVSRRYEREPALLERRRAVLHALESREEEVAAFVKDLTRRIVDAHLATMRRFDIAYDLLTWESDIIGLGFLQRALELLKQASAIVYAESGKHAGCWVMPPEDADADTDDDETKVLVKSDGIATYTAKDIAYQLWKFGLLGIVFHYQPWQSDGGGPATTASHAHPGEIADGFGGAARVINVIDARQAYPQSIVQRALRRLGHETEADRSVHLAYEVVALTPEAARDLGVDVAEGRELVALSGRRGIEVRADDLLDRSIERVREKARNDETARLVAAGAIRYYLLRFSLSQIIAFDFDEALRVTGETGVYLQYAHARSSGILRKVADEADDPLVMPAQLEPVERALLHAIDAYPRALAETATSLAPVVLTNYAFTLASALSDVYEHTQPIVRETDMTVRRFRRRLVAATRSTLADALHTLGMAAPDQI